MCCINVTLELLPRTVEREVDDGPARWWWRQRQKWGRGRLMSQGIRQRRLGWGIAGRRDGLGRTPSLVTNAGVGEPPLRDGQREAGGVVGRSRMGCLLL